MTSGDPECASWVCSTCRTRKKGCDKQLPRCGYCAKRNLICIYHDTPPSGSSENSDGSISAILSGTLPTTWNPQLPLSPFSDPCPPMGLDDVLQVHVSHFFQLSNLSLPDIAQSFFRGPHNWLPVISPSLFHDTITWNSQGPLPADVSVVVLAMCLLTWNPSNSLLEPIKPETLYITVKALFAQVQAVICSSTALVQAGLLIAAYDYARGQTDAAWIAIGMCVKLAQTIRLDSKLQDELPLSFGDRLKSLEERNIWWGVVILERMIIVETRNQNLQVTTKYPSPNSPLPLDFRPGQEFSSSQLETEPSGLPNLSSIHNDRVGSFGRQAQATYFLDQVIQTIHQLETAMWRSELESLDRQIQCFLILVTEECDRVKDLRCNVIGTSLRTLFIVHEILLTGSTDASRLVSLATLDTISNITTHAAQDHVKHMIPHHVDAMPLCCAYTLRVVKKYIEDRDQNSGSGVVRDLKPFLVLIQAFLTRWSTV